MPSIHTILLSFLLISSLVLACKKKEEPPLPTGSAITATPTVGGISSATVTADAGGSTYTVTLPAGTSVKALQLTIPLSPGATIEPKPEVARDYTSPVSYTITKADNSRQIVTITVTLQSGNPTAKSPYNLINVFNFASLSPVVQASINYTTHKVTAIIPTNESLTSLVPTITVSPKATIVPASGIAQNFTKPVNYTVTAEDGSIQVYEVSVTKAISQLSDVVLCVGPKGIYALNLETGEAKWSVYTSSNYLLSENSVPVVSDGIVYAAVTDENYYNSLYGFDVTTGVKVWGTRIASNSNSGGLYSNLAIASKVVYLLTQTERVQAVDISSGATKWLTSVYDKLDYNGAPVVDNGLVYFTGAGKIYALDANTGTKKWEFVTLLNSAGSKSPAVMDGILYSTDLENLYALDATSGALKWTYKIGNSYISSPALSDGIVYVSGKDFFYALDAKTGVLKWRYSSTFNDYVIANNSLIGVSNEAIPSPIVALDLKTGSVKYKKSTELAIGGVPLLIGVDNSICFRDGRTIKMLNASTGDPKWIYNFPAGSSGFSPVLVIKDGRTYYPVESGMQQ